MKTIRAFCLVTVLLATCQGRAQTGAAIPHFSPDQAMALASDLSLGMSEKKALKFMKSKGLKNPVKIGCSHGWTCFYELADGSSLGLAIAPIRARADGAWGNGLLREAYIQRNASNVPIALQAGVLPQPGASENEDWTVLAFILVPTLVVFAAAVSLMNRRKPAT
jgi:hypothetical protein